MEGRGTGRQGDRLRVSMNLACGDRERDATKAVYRRLSGRRRGRTAECAPM